MFEALVVIVSLAAVLGAVLGLAAIRFHVATDPIVETIDALLPQTQCGQCGFPGCKPYAQAMANNSADINQCPPGGQATIAALAELLGREIKLLNPDNGIEEEPKVAFIIEAECIGCTLCIQACPVDAILGAAKKMHTVIVSECTGCALCIPPCPENCIHMLATPRSDARLQWPDPVLAVTLEHQANQRGESVA